MKTKNDQLYTPTFFLALTLNFTVGLIFTNNAIYPLYVESQGGSAAQIGLFVSAYAIAAVLSRPLVGMLIDRFGVRLVLIGGSLLMALAPLGFLTTLGEGLSPLAWTLRVVQGFGFGAYFSAFFTLAAQMAPTERRNEAVAMYGITGLAANLVGPVMGEQIVRIWGLSEFFIVMTVAGLVATFVATRFKATGDLKPSAFSLETLAATLKSRQLYFPLILAMLLAISFSTPAGFLAPLAGIRNINGFGLYFTSYAAAGIILRLIGRKWADRFGWRRILIPMFCLYGCGLTVIYFSYTIAGLILAGSLTGSAHGLAFPAVTSLGYTMAPEKGKGTAMALVTGMMDLGSFITGIVLGQIAQLMGFAAAFPFAVLAPIAAISLLIIHVIRNPQRFARAAKS
ncbi:MAG: MFS transporter [Candidatus Marinimicrobia bacterium]|nr:MFS transporter [Candidatus Neomarinimicrobiota bacterium]